MVQNSYSVDQPLMLIDGELVESENNDRFDSFNPATGEKISTIPEGTESDINLAVQAAHDAFDHWSDQSHTTRSEYLVELADIVRKNLDHLAALDAADSGNPISEMKQDISVAAETLEMFAGLSREVKGSTIPANESNSLHYTLEQPYGVVGRIIAYNHPTRFAAAKIAAPLIAGNTVVIKPPEQDSTGVMELGRLIAEETDIPAGVINIVSGFGEPVGSSLVTHEKVRKVGFTGSVETGKIVESNASQTITDVLSELGGKNPGIIFPDVDLNQAIRECVKGMNLTWCGQSCGSITRVFLHESQYEDGLQLLKEIFEGIEPGNPLDIETEMGALVSQDQLEKVKNHVELGKKEGARLITGGHQPTGEALDNGYYFRPTLFADVTPDMRVAQEEVFGPLCFVFKWSDLEQVIDWANDVEYGLTGCLFTNNVSIAHEVSERIEAGYIWVNHAGPHYLGTPFGGWKQSGNGVEEAIEEVYEFTQTKTINMKLAESGLQEYDIR